MSEEITKTIITGDYSVLVATIGVLSSILLAFFTAHFTSKLESKKFNHKLLENLYEKRYQTYTKLLEITQNLGKSATSFDDHKKAREELKNWIATSGGYLLLTEKTLKEINDMKDFLKKGKSNKDGWEKEYVRKIFVCRNNLRGSLRDEFEFFHKAEKEF